VLYTVLTKAHTVLTKAHTMTSATHLLIVALVEDQFGAICAKVTQTLLTKGRLAVRDLMNYNGFDRRTVKQALCVLIKHRFVVYEELSAKVVMYSVDLDQSLRLPLYPNFVHIVKSRHGDIAEIVLEEILHQGCTTRQAVLNTCTARLDTTNHANKDTNKDSLDNVFEVLISHHFIEPTENPLEAEEGERKKKKMRIEEEEVGRLWRVNTQTFLNLMRDDQIIQFIAQRFDASAGLVVRVILDLNVQISGDMSYMTSSASYDQIIQSLQSKHPALVPLARSYLDILSDSPLDIVKMIDEYNGGCFIVNFSSFYQEFVKHHICSIARERFGVKCHRIFSIVLSKKMIEQKQVSELAMLPFKDAKELLYKLYTEGFLAIQELHRTPDFSPLRTFYLFHVPLDKLRAKLLMTCHKAIYNMMSIRTAKLDTNSRLVEKSLRADAALLEAQRRGIPVAELEDLLTSSEKYQLSGCMKVVRQLDLGELHVLDTLCALTNYGTAPLS